MTLSDLLGVGAQLFVNPHQAPDVEDERNLSITKDGRAGKTRQLLEVGFQTLNDHLLLTKQVVDKNPTHLPSASTTTELYRLRNEYIPIIRLRDVCGLDTGVTNLKEGLLVVR